MTWSKRNKIPDNSAFLYGEKRSYADPDSSSEFIPWMYWDELAREEWWEKTGSLIDAIFAEPVMGIVSLILILVLVLSDFVPVSSWMLGVLNIIDVAIWIFFILEYLCKLVVAHDRFSFFIGPWHIVDLIIITLPFLALLIGSGYVFSRYLRVLRGVQTLQVLIWGGLTAKKHLSSIKSPDNEPEPASMRIRKLYLGSTGTGSESFQVSNDFQQCKEENVSIDNHEATWIDLSFWTEEDLIRISDLSHLPIYVLESKLREHAYPRAEIHEDIRSFFLKIPILTQNASDPRRWRLSWSGLLVLLSGSSIITISQRTIPSVEEIPNQIAGINTAKTGEEILFLLIKGSIVTIDRLITDAEEQLVFLEYQKVDSRPPNFLKMVYRIRKELGNMISWLLHTREGLQILIEGSRSGEDERLKTLMDQCSTLSGNATLTQTAFNDLSGYYLDSNGFQMNRVMEILALLTTLTLIPALIGGLLGMNLIDQPWPVTLLQIVTVISLIMVFITWVYYKSGWLSR